MSSAIFSLNSSKAFFCSAAFSSSSIFSANCSSALSKASMAACWASAAFSSWFSWSSDFCIWLAACPSDSAASGAASTASCWVFLVSTLTDSCFLAWPWKASLFSFVISRASSAFWDACSRASTARSSFSPASDNSFWAALGFSDASSVAFWACLAACSSWSAASLSSGSNSTFPASARFSIAFSSSVIFSAKAGTCSAAGLVCSGAFSKTCFMWSAICWAFFTCSSVIWRAASASLCSTWDGSGNASIFSLCSKIASSSFFNSATFSASSLSCSNLSFFFSWGLFFASAIFFNSSSRTSFASAKFSMASDCCCAACWALFSSVAWLLFRAARAFCWLSVEALSSSAAWGTNSFTSSRIKSVRSTSSAWSRSRFSDFNSVLSLSFWVSPLTFSWSAMVFSTSSIACRMTSSLSRLGASIRARSNIASRARRSFPAALANLFPFRSSNAPLRAGLRSASTFSIANFGRGSVAALSFSFNSISFFTKEAASSLMPTWSSSWIRRSILDSSR